MLIKTKVSDLKIGMYVDLRLQWLKHSFLKPRFVITSKEQIQRIVADGITEVRVDPGKSDVIADEGGAAAADHLQHSDEPADAGQHKPTVREILAAELAGDSADLIDADIDTVKIDQPDHGPAEPGIAGDAEDDLLDSDLDTMPADDRDFQAAEMAAKMAESPEVARDIQVHEMEAILADPAMPPATKAKAIYNQCSAMMEQVMKAPDAENLAFAKQVVGGIVNHLLDDDETAEYLTTVMSKDPRTYMHSINVGILGILLARATLKDLQEREMRELGAAFFFHDLGHSRTPQYIFEKPAPLNSAERALVQRHPATGARILRDTRHLSDVMGTVVLQHHERYDGSGYPEGLRGVRIHRYARICAIADTFDALTSERAYKNGDGRLPVFQALKVIKEEMVGPHDRDIFRDFVMLFN